MAGGGVPWGVTVGSLVCSGMVAVLSYSFLDSQCLCDGVSLAYAGDLYSHRCCSVALPKPRRRTPRGCAERWVAAGHVGTGSGGQGDKGKQGGEWLFPLCSLPLQAGGGSSCFLMRRALKSLLFQSAAPVRTASVLQCFFPGPLFFRGTVCAPSLWACRIVAVYLAPHINCFFGVARGLRPAA